MSSRTLRYFLVIAGLFLLAIWLPELPTHGSPAADSYRPLQTVLRGHDLELVAEPVSDAQRHGQAAESLSHYASLPTQAAAPFTDVMLHWQTGDGAGLELLVELRASLDGVSWTDWEHVEASADLYDPGTPAGSFWSVPLYAGQSRYWQVRVAAPVRSEIASLVKRIEVHTLDVGETPLEERTLRHAATSEPLALPPFYSRVDWGSPDGEGSRERPEYQDATHLVVHHTAEYSFLRSHEFWWGDRVRAIWSFHTFSRRMGDIGYNWLIDPEGNLYEGRAGAYPDFTSDPVAFHDTGNHGSMGVALIGTYSHEPPSAGAQQRLVEVLAWKARQRGIDPWGSSPYEGCRRSPVCHNHDAITPHIAGHRDVASAPGYTSCPGDELQHLLPEIRARVQAMLVDPQAQPGSGTGPVPAPPLNRPKPAAVDEAAAQPIIGETRWRAADSPVILDRDYVIIAGSTLFIDPGVEVRFANQARLVVRGVLAASGADGARIRFVGLDGGPWRGLLLEPGSAAYLSAIEIHNAGSEGAAIFASNATLVLYHSLITQGAGGITAQKSFLDVQHTTMTGNDLRFAPALVLVPGEGQPQTFMHNLIAGNRMPPGSALAQVRIPDWGVWLGIAGNVFMSETGTNLRISAAVPFAASITCNTFQGGAVGLELQTGEQDPAAFNLTVRDNAFLQHATRAAGGDLPFNLQGNWWGDHSGPQQRAGNPEGRGDVVGSDLHVAPWLLERPGCTPHPGR